MCAAAPCFRGVEKPGVKGKTVDRRLKPTCSGDRREGDKLASCGGLRRGWSFPVKWLLGLRGNSASVALFFVLFFPTPFTSSRRDCYQQWLTGGETSPTLSIFFLFFPFFCFLLLLFVVCAARSYDDVYEEDATASPCPSIAPPSVLPVLADSDAEDGAEDGAVVDYTIDGDETVEIGHEQEKPDWLDAHADVDDDVDDDVGVDVAALVLQADQSSLLPSPWEGMVEAMTSPRSSPRCERAELLSQSVQVYKNGVALVVTRAVAASSEWVQGWRWRLMESKALPVESGF